jgi:hypothetical protein
MDVKVLLLALDDKFSGLMSKLEDRISKVKAMKGDTGPAGVAGPKGDVGPKGDTGPEGKPGKDGKDGKDGEDGAEGKEGVGVEDASVDFDGHLVLTLTNGEEVDAGSVKDLNEAQAPNVYNISMGSMASRADLKNATAKTISTPHTTAGSEILKVTEGVVIHLTQHPQDRETVIVNCRTDDRIDIVGEISIVNMSYYDVAQYNIDEFGAGSLIIEQDDTTIHLVYIQEFKEWLAI